MYLQTHKKYIIYLFELCNQFAAVISAYVIQIFLCSMCMVLHSA